MALVRKFISHDLSIGGEKVELGTELGIELGTGLGATLGVELGVVELGAGVGVEVGTGVVGTGVGEGVGGQILSPQPQVTVPLHTLKLVVKISDLLCQLQ